MDQEKLKNRFKNFTPEKKLELSLQLYYSAYNLKKAALKNLYPNLDKKQIEEKVKQIFQYART